MMGLVAAMLGRMDLTKLARETEGWEARVEELAAEQLGSPYTDQWQSSCTLR